MIGSLVMHLAALIPLQNNSHIVNEPYYQLPRFWTNTGFCPSGEIKWESLKFSLFSESVQMNLMHLAALPTGALTHIRIHWLLELVKFVQYTQAGVPVYDFSDLDDFILNLNDLGLYPVIEFMTDLDGILINNSDIMNDIWEDFSYQVTKRYLNLLGAKNLVKWRFETWNEPDIHNYNILNFTVEGFIEYAMALRKGIKSAGHMSNKPLDLTLRGPAGLFKSKKNHPLCWSLIKNCNDQINDCPINVLTYHRKGQGLATEVLEASSKLLKNIYANYYNINMLPVSNDEADPITGWSTPQDFYEDVRYAAKLVYIVFLHWHAKLNYREFKYLETISHDNAFISYHPFEFTQRTLLAHFRMNNSQPVHSQFIQKPVYAALGMLSKLAPVAADIEVITLSSPNDVLWLLKTSSTGNKPLYVSWLLLPRENTEKLENFTLHRQLPFKSCSVETFAYVVELLEQEKTDPAYIWRTQAGSRPFPDAIERAAMRYAQTPRLQASGLLLMPEFSLNISGLQLPWILLFRVCSNLSPVLKRPEPPTITKITIGEIFISWREAANTTNCLKTYEVWFQVNQTAEWSFISENWHLPYPSFQYAPINACVTGFFKVRAIDFLNRKSNFSDAIEYIEMSI
ncbi:alpha-L-iduronidase isoform X2 [Bactrocera neohumeralis]|uniref:alpha-L-iduronidase n=1 Tax=Bactrocera tryoni TaxID=59916 RepID=UPI001A977303|nr:alpha-L-iduronidase [Bactrocera tryoni]XP_050319126.1 alpha-L-iduronidase isoform X2 [Bactrocera neohumeralis]